ncbi:MAG: PP2C family protein-serine/threonine phosphatase [Pseudanabaenaceae cyanobacterium]
MRDSLKTHIQELQVTTAAQHKKIESELEIARQIQLSLLSKIALTKPQDNRYDICGFLQPAPKVGGDFYDCFWLDPDRLIAAIGDVAGKGIPLSYSD